MPHRIKIGPSSTAIVLPDGREVLGSPHDTDPYRASARDLGYGDDALGMCLDHDPLHALVADWLGLDASYSLRIAAGETLVGNDQRLALLEEDVVMAIQRFLRKAGLPLPTSHTNER